MLRLKEKAARRWVVGSLGCAIVLWCSSTLAAAPHVLLWELEPSPPALLANLQIQLSSLVRLEPRTAAAAVGGTSARIRAATALARSEGALAVVWIDPTIERQDGGREATLYVVGDRDGRALLEVVSVSGAQGPELDRTLALKLREVLAEMLTEPQPAPSAALLRPAPEPVVGEPNEPGLAADTHSQGTDSSAASRWGLLVSAGPRWVSQPEFSRWGFGFAAGPTLQLTHLSFGLVLGVDWLSEASEEQPPRSASISELVPQLRFQARTGGSRLFATLHTGPALSLITATGTRPPMRSAEDDLALFSWLVGVGAELSFGAGWACAANVDLQAFTRHEYIAVGDVTLIDLGRIRVVVGLDLLWHMTP